MLVKHFIVLVAHFFFNDFFVAIDNELTIKSGVKTIGLVKFVQRLLPKIEEVKQKEAISYF